MAKRYKVQVVIDAPLWEALRVRAKRRGTNVAAELRALALASARRSEELEDALDGGEPRQDLDDGR